MKEAEKAGRDSAAASTVRWATCFTAGRLTATAYQSSTRLPDAAIVQPWGWQGQNRVKPKSQVPQ